MSTIIRNTLKLSDGKLMIETETTPSGATWTEADTEASAKTAIDAAYDPASGWTYEPTTANEILASPLWIIRRWLLLFAQYLITSADRVNPDGTIVRVWTVTQP